MKLRAGAEAVYADWKAKNADPYGAAVLEYADRWAELMEAEIAGGSALGDVAEGASRDADTDGITGVMHGCAVGFLSVCWERGEELRRWHNLRSQMSGEGARANETPGAVLNPAVVTLRVAPEGS